MSIHTLLTSVSVSLLSGAVAWATKAILPRLRALWAGVYPLLPGDTASRRNGENFMVLERRGTAFRYEYKLVNVRKINPWLLPALCYNPQFTDEAAVFWYKGSKGSCYLKKTGHPKLELRMPVLSR